MKDLISVIVPVYNVEKYIEDCIKSILEQTYKNLEIILVDDESSDASGKICEEYSKIDNRIKVIHQKNGGAASARNAGLKIATGQYIAFVDSDDTINEKMCEELYNLLKKYDTQVAMCGVWETHENEKGEIQKVVLEQKEIKDEVLTCEEALKLMITSGDVGNFVCNKLFKRELFDDITFPEGKVYEDAATTYKIIHKCNKVAYTNKKMYYYLLGRSGATTSSFSEKKILDSLDAYSSQYKFLIENHKNLKDVANVIWIKMYTSAMEKICMNNYWKLWESDSVLDKYEFFKEAIDSLNIDLFEKYLEPYRIISAVLLGYNRNLYKDMFNVLYDKIKK